MPRIAQIRETTSIRANGLKTVAKDLEGATFTMATCTRGIGFAASAMAKARPSCRRASDTWVCGRLTGGTGRELSGVPMGLCTWGPSSKTRSMARDSSTSPTAQSVSRNGRMAIREATKGSRTPATASRTCRTRSNNPCAIIRSTFNRCKSPKFRKTWRWFSRTSQTHGLSTKTIIKISLASQRVSSGLRLCESCIRQASKGAIPNQGPLSSNSIPLVRSRR